MVQQGMNGASALARRYHGHSANVRYSTVQPYSADRSVRSTFLRPVGATGLGLLHPNPHER